MVSVAPAPVVVGPTKSLVRRFSITFLISQLGWAIPGSASGILLQQLAAVIDESQKVFIYASAGTVGAIVGSVTAVLWGVLSDRVHARYGSRALLIVGGAIIAGLSIAATGLAQDAAGLIVATAFYQLGLGAMVGSVSAAMSDYVESSILGRVSAAAGLGVLLGQMIGAVVGGALVEDVRLGFVVVSWTIPVGAILFVLLLRRTIPMIPAPPVPTETAAIRAVHARGRWAIGDFTFWSIFAGRALFMLALYMASQFLLYISTDYLGLDTAEAGKTVAIAAIIFALCAGVFIVISGPLSDRIQRRKPFVAGGSIVLALATIPMLVSPSVLSLILFMVFAGAAFGSYVAVDQALMVDALPTTGSKARDLGILGIATTLPGVFAPAVAGAVVTVIGYPGLFVGVALVAVVAGACMFGVRRLR